MPTLLSKKVSHQTAVAVPTNTATVADSQKVKIATGLSHEEQTFLNEVNAMRESTIAESQERTNKKVALVKQYQSIVDAWFVQSQKQAKKEQNRIVHWFVVFYSDLALLGLADFEQSLSYIDQAIEEKQRCDYKQPLSITFNQLKLYRIQDYLDTQFDKTEKTFKNIDALKWFNTFMQAQLIENEDGNKPLNTIEKGIRKNLSYYYFYYLIGLEKLEDAYRFGADALSYGTKIQTALYSLKERMNNLTSGAGDE